MSNVLAMRLDRPWDQLCFAICLEALYTEVFRYKVPVSRARAWEIFVKLGHEFA